MTPTKRKAISKKEKIEKEIDDAVRDNYNMFFVGRKKFKTIDEATAYQKGYDDGARSQAKIFNDTYDNAQQVKKDISWGKWDIQINWCAVLLAIMLGVIISRMIIDIGYGFINA